MWKNEIKYLKKQRDCRDQTAEFKSGGTQTLGHILYKNKKKSSHLMVDSLLDGTFILTLSHCASSGSNNTGWEIFSVTVADF